MYRNFHGHLLIIIVGKILARSTPISCGHLYLDMLFGRKTNAGRTISASVGLPAK